MATTITITLSDNNLIQSVVVAENLVVLPNVSKIDLSIDMENIFSGENNRLCYETKDPVTAVVNKKCISTFTDRVR